MKKITLITLLLITALFNLNAQLTTVLDFDGTNGGNPYGSLISDGTYLYGMAGGGANNVGVIFKIKISDNTYTKMFDFTVSSGVSPFGSLCLEGDYLYGMTILGGANSDGVVFKINKNNNAYSKIIDLNDAVTGKFPYAGFVSDGTYIYGTTSSGGTNGYGTLFKIKLSDDSFTIILDFIDAYHNCQSTPVIYNDHLYITTLESNLSSNSGTVAFPKKDGSEPYTLFIFDEDNNNDGYAPKGDVLIDESFIFFMASEGGTSNYGTIIRRNLSTSSYMSYNFDWSTGANPEGSLIKAGTEYYGMAKKGGADDVGTIFKVDVNLAYTVLYEFDGTDGRYPRGSLLKVGNYLYGMTNEGGANNKGTIFKYQYTTSDVSNVKNQDINIYPNPVTNYLTINSQNNINKIEISDVSGKKIFSKIVNTKHAKVETLNFVNGLYFLKTFMNNEVFIQKFIKQ